MPPLLADTATLAVVPQGTPGSTAYTYGLVGVDANGKKSLVETDVEASGNAVLDETNFNRMTWTDVAGYISYEIWRIASAGTPATTGLIGTVLATVQTFDDTGLAAVAGTASAANTTGIGDEIALNHYNGDLSVSGEGVGTGTYQLEGTFGGIWMNEGSALTAAGVLAVTRKYTKVRFRNTAFTSGSPQGYVGGDNH